MRNFYSTFSSVYFLFFIVIFSLSSCKDDEGEIVDEPTVNYNLNAMPYQKLSTYNFFQGEIENMNPINSVLPYEPASSLFTDYALKKRFIWMPSGSKATYNGDHNIFDFPTGTILIKNFYYTTLQPGNQTKILETRLMIKKASGWIFAEYLWNDEQTDATLDMNGSTKPITFIQNGETISTDYRFPNEVECLICHKKNEVAIPIAPKPQNLNFTFNYTDGAKHQLQKWVEKGYLQSYPSTIVSTINYKDTSKPLEDRLRSYVDMNCSHCHKLDGHCDYTPIKFAFSETVDITNLGVCVIPNNPINGSVKIIAPGNFVKSTMHVRMNSNVDDVKMPIIGRSVVHKEAVQLVEQYINSLTTTCN